MNDSGEKELVLGNKQLLAIFFVGVLLCGVFFVVGYVVGGNSAKSLSTTTDATSSTSTSSGSEGKREEPQAQTAADNYTPSTYTPTPSDTGGMVPTAEPRMADNPAASGSQPTATSAPATRIPAQPFQSQPEVNAAAASPGSTASTGIFVSVPEKGANYVQVIATPRPHADDMVKILREAKLPAILAESPTQPLFEVLVGPYRTPLTLAEAKRKLTDLSFYGQLYVHKY